ncbi:MAG TPA: hypothetical protein VHT93_06925 [Pseudolabrys sp.]|jgi:hypothetical protein|nr:hypothetical protein [Pseudolabrys sp.]
MTQRCILVIPDAGPINSLWVANSLNLLLALKMPIIIIDEVYAELTSEPERYQKAHDVKAFVEGHADVFKIEKTTVGHLAAQARARGETLTDEGLGEAAIAEFFKKGIEKYARADEPVLLLFEDSDIRTVRFVRKPANMHLLTTIAMLRGLEEKKVIKSADEIIRAMMHPTDPLRKGRKFNDLPNGIGEPAVSP